MIRTSPVHPSAPRPSSQVAIASALTVTLGAALALAAFGTRAASGADALAGPPGRDILALAGSGEFHRYRGPVDALDVVGGFASEFVVIRTTPGAVPQRGEAGWTFVAGTGADGGATIDGRADLLAGLLAAADLDGAIAPAIVPAPANAALAERFGLDRSWLVQLRPGRDPRDVVAALGGFGAPVEAAELLGIGGLLGTFPDDPSFGNQYGLHNTGQVIQGQAGLPGADMNLPAAWSLETGSSDLIIAIIDTGVSASHPDLVPKLVPGWNTVSNNSNSDDSVLISHGSHCAGIAAAASDNGIGIAGVAWGSRIMPVKVLNFIGGGTEAGIANGIIWAADNGANIGSMSLGFPGATSLLENACGYADAAGMLLLAATGNTAGAAISAPARYATVVAVGATDNTDTIASFTTTGPEMSVTAPGVNVYSCWDTLFSPNTYSWQSGTSMACPHAAGVAALVWSANPALTRHAVREILESTAKDLGQPGWDPTYGHGRVDAHAAVLEALARRCGAGDLDCDGSVGPADLGLLLASWGTAGPGDLNGDGAVDESDVAILLSLWSS